MAVRPARIHAHSKFTIADRNHTVIRDLSGLTPPR
jgi:hypothetical protein